jgi:hypothetical protein
MSGLGSGLCGHKQSYCTSVRTGNWIEDAAGKRLAASSAQRYAAAPFGTSVAHDTWVNPGPSDVKVAFAPRPVDTIDGHYVMAHGTNIFDRAPDADMYLTLCVGQGPGEGGASCSTKPPPLLAAPSLTTTRRHAPPPPPLPFTIPSSAQAATRGLKPVALLNPHYRADVPMRTDLIRARALAREAGVTAGDPTLCGTRSNVPRVLTTVSVVGAAQLPPPRPAAAAAIGARALAASAALGNMGGVSGAPQFARDNSFSKTWGKVKPRA